MERVSNKAFRDLFRELGRFTVLWLSVLASENIETSEIGFCVSVLGVSIVLQYCAYGFATHPEMSAAADSPLKTTLWTTWTTTRTTKAGSVFSTLAARKPATMNGSIPFPYYMWYSTISMYPTLDPLPSPPTRPCMSHPHLMVRLPRPRLHKLLIPIRSFTNTLQSVQVPLLRVIAHL